MRINIDSLTPIKVARHYDGAADVIEFDVGRWIEAYPALTEYRVEVTSPGGAVYLPESVVLDGNVLKWSIMPSDTGTAGNGEYQIVATGANGERKTSTSARFVVREIMEGTAGETPPDPAQPWVDKVLDAAERAEAAAERAENAGGSGGGGSGGGTTQESDPTVPAWAKQPNPPTYTAEDVGARPADWLPTLEEIGAQPAGNYALKNEIPTVPVQSVNGKTGAIKLNAEDVGAASAESVAQLSEEIVDLNKAAVKSINGAKPDENGNVQVQGGGSEGVYELIETITAEEDIAFNRTQEPDGTPYKFDAVFIATSGTAQSDKTIDLRIFAIKPGSSEKRVASQYCQFKAGETRYRAVEVYKDKGYWWSDDFTATTNNMQYSSTLKSGAYYNFKANTDIYPHITRVETSAAGIPAGTIVEIWAVRAK